MKLSLEEYRALVEQAPILIWRADTTGECNYFNEQWLAFTGRAMAQETGNGWAEGVHPDDFQRCLDIYLDHFGRRAVFEMEYRLKRHDGEYRWIFDRGVPYFDDVTGDFLGFIGSCIDITTRVEARDALRKAQEEELRALQGLLPICMHCKKIRDDQDRWQPVEVYVRDRSKADFSHGICPDCLARNYPSVAQGVPPG
jgi:PAS domain S-box-containing protein